MSSKISQKNKPPERKTRRIDGEKLMKRTTCGGMFKQSIVPMSSLETPRSGFVPVTNMPKTTKTSSASSRFVRRVKNRSTWETNENPQKNGQLKET